MKKRDMNLNLRQLPKFEYNPFVFPDDRAVTIQKDGDTRIISNGNESDPFKVKGMIKMHEVDNEKFVKIYTNHISMWFELSSAGQRVLQYIMTVLPKDQDEVFFNINRAMAYTKYSSTVSLYEGLAELINQKIIARSEYPSIYFINPRFLFNGDRVVFAEAIMRSPQAIQERNTMLARMHKRPPVTGDVPDQDEDDEPTGDVSVPDEGVEAPPAIPTKSFFEHIASLSD